MPILPALCLLLVSLITAPVWGEDDAMAREAPLIALFENYNRAAGRADIEGMLALRTAAIVAEVRSAFAEDPGARDFFVEMGKAQVPERSELEHIDWSEDGESAEVYWLWTLAPMPEVQRERRIVVEGISSFKREDATWKLGDLTMLMDVALIKRPTDLSFDYEDADTEFSASVGGRITRFEFKDNHTLVMIRTVDEEIAVFLPPRKVLEDAGVDFAEYAPWKRRQFDGYRHRDDGLRFFATGDSPM